MITSRDRPDLYDEWVQLNALFARLTSAKVFNLIPCGVICLESLLAKSKKVRNLFVSAGAQYLILSSTHLFTYCNTTGNLNLWSNWLDAFSSAAEDHQLGESERGLAHRAAETMKSPVYDFVYAIGNENLRWSSPLKFPAQTQRRSISGQGPIQDALSIRIEVQHNLHLHMTCRSKGSLLTDHFEKILAGTSFQDSIKM